MDGMAFFGKFSGNDRAAESGSNAEVVWHEIYAKTCSLIMKGIENEKENVNEKINL